MTTKSESIIKLLHGDCLELMKDIGDKSIDMILCDLPYGTTACKWDTIIPFEPLWEQYKRIIKDNGAIVLTASQPFTSALVMSNVKMFKYCWVWLKIRGSNPMLAKKQPLKYHEDIAVFYKKQPTYNPEMVLGNKNHSTKSHISTRRIHGDTVLVSPKNTSNMKYPRSFQKFNTGDNSKQIHPTQKPVALMEYLIKTYTNEGDLVLDNCMGSGTTGVACKNLNRDFIGMEMDANYFEIATKRINDCSLTPLQAALI